MSQPRTPLRAEFEEQRRRTAFLAALPAAFAGIIAGDTWVHPIAGLVVGPACGLVAYGLTYGYDTWMWRRRHGGSGHG